MAFKEGFDSRIRYGRLLGLLFLVAGFVTIGVAWNGAAGQFCVDCQFPYLISGGATGLGLIILGSTLLVVSSLRAERLHLQSAIERAGARAADDSGTKQFTAVHTGASPNGHVVIGRSTYHRPDCRLVQGKADLSTATIEEAEELGLSACRVCSPVRSDRKRSSR